MLAKLVRLLVVLFALAVVVRAQQQPPVPSPPPATPAPAQPPTPSQFRFKSGVDLINVTATVTDATGRFVSGLTQEDFTVYEDDRPVDVTHFSAERVPVSLGIALDTSGSMNGQKIQEAQTALNRFLYDLLGPQDEIFLYRFSNYPVLLQGWTSDRNRLSRALYDIRPNGGTAMYDTVSEAIPLAQKGNYAKKSLLIISDGNDTTSHTDVPTLKQQIRASEVLVYAIGIDGEAEDGYAPPRRQPPPPMPIPLPFPGGRGRGGWPFPGGGSGGGYGGGGGGGQGYPRRGARSDDRVNVTALRDLTDDSGGRTEIVHDPRDLNPSTANIADELSKQYYLGYSSPAKRDGRWHTIRVEVKSRTYRVRARKGYVAS
jgi:Ca-activated chloride channel family protein